MSRKWLLFFLTSRPGMLRGVRQERHQHEQAGRHLTGGKIPCLWHEDPTPHQGLRLCFRKGNWPGWREPDGCLAPTYGKNVKRLLSLLLFLHLSGTEGNGGAHRSARFHSWKCLGLCLSNILCGFVTLAKNDSGPARREKCGLFVGTCKKNTLKLALVRSAALKVSARSERSEASAF